MLHFKMKMVLLLAVVLTGAEGGESDRRNYRPRPTPETEDEISLGIDNEEAQPSQVDLLHATLIDFIEVLNIVHVNEESDKDFYLRILLQLMEIDELIYNEDISKLKNSIKSLRQLLNNNSLKSSGLGRREAKKIKIAYIQFMRTAVNYLKSFRNNGARKKSHKKQSHL